uniref:Uncharacterized protein n=1 Tax=Chromera velia CCMP2878 TaxID=1169474 RepID=A0A0G4IDC6_9ALVE|mmetsp:Transcript_32024/g.63478  ORF Transcript_32024/g.63478 Transcript_32024/m.63478 type:complete len:454 (+) Transcript_32024:128-1489(+)|eukprot:Cvel_2342.t1-p1 / transcript=Cvel_2342.t1 / gene=Cvel_2342 / organism=Chromera_velia_CCMP2878 / gene_product=hypothetical protein / transcript_product=hypothetical protein / location=Cvel_scaffold90:135172-139570(+) / protein_length=453 / sequence_SO=supercontig / SO=protein_coding / is_pseudo=false
MSAPDEILLGSDGTKRAAERSPERNEDEGGEGLTSIAENGVKRQKVGETGEREKLPGEETGKKQLQDLEGARIRVRWTVYDDDSDKEGEEEDIVGPAGILAGYAVCEMLGGSFDSCKHSFTMGRAEEKKEERTDSEESGKSSSTGVGETKTGNKPETAAFTEDDGKEHLEKEEKKETDLKAWTVWWPCTLKSADNDGEGDQFPMERDAKGQKVWLACYADHNTPIGFMEGSKNRVIVYDSSSNPAEDKGEEKREQETAAACDEKTTTKEKKSEKQQTPPRKSIVHLDKAIPGKPVEWRFEDEGPPYEGGRWEQELEVADLSEDEGEKGEEDFEEEEGEEGPARDEKMNCLREMAGRVLRTLPAERAQQVALKLRKGIDAMKVAFNKMCERKLAEQGVDIDIQQLQREGRMPPDSNARIAIDTNDVASFLDEAFRSVKDSERQEEEERQNAPFF